MEDKIKGLEENIQAYIDAHPGCEVIVERSRDAKFYNEVIASSHFTWTITVMHDPTAV